MYVVIALLSIGGLAFLASLALSIFVERRAARWGFVDRPCSRKDHQGDVPLLGGVALFATLVGLPGLALIAWSLVGEAARSALAFSQLAVLAEEVFVRSPRFLWLALSATLVFAFGLLDDRRALRPRTKFLLQVLAATVAVVAGGITLSLLPSRLLNDIGAILWIIAIANAFNFLDNMNGLLAGLATITAALFFVLCVCLSQYAMAAMLAVYAGASLGFLVRNFPRARLFMGDAGSQLLGFVMALLTVQGTYVRASEAEWTAWVIAPALLALPLLDLLFVCGARWRAGVPLSRGDHRHISHRLVANGLTRKDATLFVWSASFAMGALAIALPYCSALLICLCVAGQLLLFALIHPLSKRAAKVAQQA